MIPRELFEKALNQIHKAERILVTTHTKPDGDACGSVIVMCDALKAQGKYVQSLFLSSIPSRYQCLFPEEANMLGQQIQVDDLTRQPFGPFDLTILMDVNSITQLPGLETYLKAARGPVLVMDHHVTGQGLGTVELVDSSAAATGIIVYDFLQYVHWPLTEEIAEALFIAAATDTGWFQFRNADSRVYHVCASLIDAGARPTEIYDKLYQNMPLSRFLLMRRMLNTLTLYFENRFAVQTISHEDFVETGADYHDTENLINECHRIETVKASVLLVELEDGRVRCSLRSRGAVDVSVIAARFGGGGHKMAAGAFVPGPLDHAVTLIKDVFSHVFQSVG
jgi:phosphoesterase RecJ-like protein